jgi:hypothetical protein
MESKIFYIKVIALTKLLIDNVPWRLAIGQRHKRAATDLFKKDKISVMILDTRGLYKNLMHCRNS